MNAPDSINELARIEEELEYQLGGVKHRISALKDRSRPQEWQGGGDNTPLSEGTDVAQAMGERASESEQMARLLDRAAGLQRALRRIQDGTYGRCERCDRSIGTKRLRALPEALLCVDCEEQMEMAS